MTAMIAKLKRLVVVLGLVLAAGCQTEIVEVCPSCSPLGPGDKDGGFLGNPDLGDGGRFMPDSSVAQPDASARDSGPVTMNDGGAASD